MGKMFAGISALTFGLSVLAHLLSHVAAVRVTMGRVGLLHLAVIVVFGAMVVMFRLQSARLRKQTGGTTYEADRALWRGIPTWAKVIGGVGFVLIVVSILSRGALFPGGSPDIWDGRYVLHSHGRLIRELTEEEYWRAEAEVVRGFSAIWMIFAWPPVVYFWAAHPRIASRLD